MSNKNWSYGLFFQLHNLLYYTKLIHTILHVYEFIYDGIQYHITILKSLGPYYDNYYKNIM